MGRGRRAGGLCLRPPGPGLHEPLCPSVSCQRGGLTGCPRLRVAEVWGPGVCGKQQRVLAVGARSFLPPPSLGLGLGVPVLPSYLPPDPEPLLPASPGSQGWEGLCAVNTPLMAPGPLSCRPTRVPRCPALLSVTGPSCPPFTPMATPSCLSWPLPWSPFLQTSSHPWWGSGPLNLHPLVTSARHLQRPLQAASPRPLPHFWPICPCQATVTTSWVPVSPTPPSAPSLWQDPTPNTNLSPSPSTSSPDPLHHPDLGPLSVPTAPHCLLLLDTGAPARHAPPAAGGALRSLGVCRAREGDSSALKCRVDETP